jgi:pimeloyl-ACP methyl ester carboxylesterase
MLPSLSCWLGFLFLNPTSVDTKLVQLHPGPHEAAPFERTAGSSRAVVLIHGLQLHAVRGAQVRRASLQSWQRPDGELVRVLGRDSDVFGFAYAQNVSVDAVARSLGLRRAVEQLHDLGYRDIVLVGHSAGGLVARQFVEDFPDEPVAKVIQVGTPNGGSAWAKSHLTLCREQEAFLGSLTKQARQKALDSRAAKRVPEHVQFVCVVTVGQALGDWIVACRSQWTEDLQEQGIPAVPVRRNHFSSVRTRETAKLLGELIRDEQPRWDAARVGRTRRDLFGERAPDRAAARD